MERKEQSQAKSIAYSYIRLSSRQQITGDGQRRQLEAAQDYCNQNNLTLSPKSFRDLGISAFKELDRPSLSDLHECIDRGIIKAGDHVILEKLDRLSRQGIDKTTDMLKAIIRHGVIVVSLMDGLRLDKDSLNDLTSVIRIAIAADIANKESAAKSTRIQANKDAMREKIRQGIPVSQKLPFWLKFQDGQYEFDERLSILERMIDLRKSGTSLDKIAKTLNEDGIPSINKDTAWTSSTIRDVFKNPILYGAHQITTKVGKKYQNLELVQDYYPAVMTYSEFRLINGTSVVRLAGNSEINPLSGLVYCGYCGYKMIIKSRKNRDDSKVIYHYCRKATVGACDMKSNIKNLYKSVIENISHLSKKEIVKPVADIEEMRGKLSAIEARIRELTNEMSNVDSLLPITAIVAAVSKLESAKAELNTSIAGMTQIDSTALESVLENMGDPKKFNQDLKKVIKAITVSPYGEYQKIKVERHDGHWISWKTGGFGAGVVDSEKSLRMVEEMLVEEE